MDDAGTGPFEAWGRPTCMPTVGWGDRRLHGMAKSGDNVDQGDGCPHGSTGTVDDVDWGDAWLRAGDNVGEGDVVGPADGAPGAGPRLRCRAAPQAQGTTTRQTTAGPGTSGRAAPQ